MNVRRIFGAVGALALAAGGVLASSTPAQATVTVCTYTVDSVRALDLQEDGVNSTDEIWVVINGIFFRSDSVAIKPSDGTVPGTRFGDQTPTPQRPRLSSTGSASIGLVEDDLWPDGNDPLDADTVSCAVDSDTLVISDEADYEYLVHYTVTTTQV